jgi:hypothetical protein
VIGIDTIQLIPNLKRLFDFAKDNNFKILPCLLNAGDTTLNNGHFLGVKGQKKILLDKTRQQILKSIVEEKPIEFIKNALIPFITEFSKHDAFYAVELINEPEIMVTKNQVTSYTSIKKFIMQCLKSIKQISPKIDVIIGTNSIDLVHLNDIVKILDFINYHCYCYNKREVKKVLSPENLQLPKNGINRLGLGEFGYAYGNDPLRARSEIEVAKECFDSAYRNNYNPCLCWRLDYYMPENQSKILKLLEDYKKKKLHPS